MAHYLVYVPDQHVQAAGDHDPPMHPLEYVGLADHVASAFQVGIASGPDGQAGSLFGWHAPTAAFRLQHTPDRQDWIPAVPHHDQPAARYWLGFWKDSPPTPVDLQKPKMLPGIELELGPENQPWRIPTDKSVPVEADFGPSGEWMSRVQPEYADYCAEVITWQNTLDSGTREFVLDDVYAFVVRLLSLNYRVTREVVQRLRLLREEDVIATMMTATGRSDLIAGGGNG